MSHHYIYTFRVAHDQESLMYIVNQLEIWQQGMMHIVPNLGGHFAYVFFPTDTKRCEK